MISTIISRLGDHSFSLPQLLVAGYCFVHMLVYVGTCMFWVVGSSTYLVLVPNLLRLWVMVLTQYSTLHRVNNVLRYFSWPDLTKIKSSSQSLLCVAPITMFSTEYIPFTILYKKPKNKSNYTFDTYVYQRDIQLPWSPLPTCSLYMYIQLLVPPVSDASPSELATGEYVLLFFTIITDNSILLILSWVLYQ